MSDYPAIVVSENRRFLAHSDGSPFFYLGDTAWELFHRLSREDIEEYLACRAEQGFSVIHAVALAEFSGLTEPNFYGDLPLIDLDPTRPNERYFEHVDWVIDRAWSKGLRIGLLPTWGDKVPDSKWGDGPIVFDEKNALNYGAFLGARYRDKPLVWIIGGDRPVETETQRLVWEAIVKGIKEAGADQLMLFHPPGGRSSAEFFHNSDWLDANMVQSGHVGFEPNFRYIRHDYALTPVKPCMDGEPCYEDHPVMTPDWTPTSEYYGDYEARRAAYWSLFSGSHGHTYGCQAVWQFLDGTHEPINGARTPWKKAVHLACAEQLRYAVSLLLSRPFFERIPDQSLVRFEQPDDRSYIASMRATDGSYAFIYSPNGKPFELNLSPLKQGELKAKWFDPRSGLTGTEFIVDRDTPAFMPPLPGLDWVLIIDA